MLRSQRSTLPGVRGLTPLDRGSLWRLLLLLAIYVAAVPAFFVWAFFLVDVSTESDLNGFVRLLWWVVMVVPAVAALYYFGVRIYGVLTRFAADGVSPATTGWLSRLAWAMIGIVSFTGVVALGVAGFAAFLALSQPGAPGAFYDAPSPLPSAPPGTVIRSEPLGGAPETAVAWKILYLSTSYSGKPTAVSATLVVPKKPAPPEGRPAVAFAHGTVGVARNCAPSTRSYWAKDIDGLDEFLKAGYAIVATDYEGLGTSGPHPYLVGKAAAMNVLDSVRAAHNFTEAGAGTSYVVWGYSQGAHSSLFTGELSASYAPDLKLVGVAVGAPPTDLATLFERDLGTTFGNVLATYAFVSWSKVYENADLRQIVRGVARPVVKNTAKLCIREEEEATSILPGSIFMRIAFLSNQPVDTEPWKSLVEENSPGRSMIPAPIFIVQGENDGLVHADVTEAFAKSLCAKGETVAFRSYPNVNHITAVPIVTSDIATWIVDRFAEKPAPSTCS
jgi:acetyl esterase/lipase